MGVFIKLVKWSFPVLSSKLSNIFIGTPSTFLSGFILQSTALYLAHKDFFLLLMFIHLFSNLSDSSNLYTTNELGLNVNIFIMSLPFYFNNNPITYTDFLVFRTNKMIRLAVDIDFSRNTSSEPYNSYLKLSCFNINSNTISFTLLLVYQLIKSKNTTKKYYIHIFFNSK